MSLIGESGGVLLTHLLRTVVLTDVLAFVTSGAIPSTKLPRFPPLEVRCSTLPPTFRQSPPAES
ncbi:MAG TPA: hypothetical protein VMW38_05900, partial [Terriglobia bacterium]|nr:hypothetical protein [Terriglobia bacterium]